MYTLITAKSLWTIICIGEITVLFVWLLEYGKGLPHEIYTFKIYTTKFIQKNLYKKNLYNLKFIQKKFILHEIYTFLKNPKSSHLKYIIAFLNCYIVMRLRG